MIWQTRSKSFDDTERLGQSLGRLIKNPLVIELQADLGGGKTTFVRGLAKGLDCSGAITSPSFTLSREYDCRGKLKLYHFDFYRLPEAGIVADQLSEALQNPNAVVVVEWSDIVNKVLPDKRLTIELRPVENNADERNIIFEYHESQSELVRRLETERESIQP